MKLAKLQLENFRNYRRYSHDFAKDNDLTIVVGPNGKGKTNFLEAIYVLSLGRSFRSLLRDDLIEWNMDYMRCSGKVEMGGPNQRSHREPYHSHHHGPSSTNASDSADTDELNLEVFYTNYPNPKKNFKRNGVNLKNSEYLGNLLTVLFHPEDLNMLYLSPNLRRRYLDTVLCQTDRHYLNALINYKHVLKQRNALLHEIRETKFKNRDQQTIAKLLEDLDAWDKEIVEFGTPIIAKRQAFTEFLNRNITKIYRSISGNRENVKVVYQTKVTAAAQSAASETVTSYKEKLLERRLRDVGQAKTTLGPHRDDLVFYINEKEISHSASRGEIRSLLLAIKLLEIKFIQKKTGQSPVLLLDDVFSELDRKRQSHLLKSIKGCQTIIATTDIHNLKQVAKTSEIIDFAER